MRRSAEYSRCVNIKVSIALFLFIRLLSMNNYERAIITIVERLRFM